ncbi:MAG: hypothetical protein J0M18_12285 [Ignavibacteria bacterium]|nr:hypothetical protein [Ignavibacteria bacterium]
MSEFNFTYPKKNSTAAELSAAIKKWQDSVPAPTLNEIPKGQLPQDFKIQSVKLTSARIKTIHEIHTSDNPLGEAVAGQKETPEQFLGTLHTALTTLNYVKLEGEYKKLLREVKTDKAKKELQVEWETVNKAAQAVYASAGLKDVTRKDLETFAQELSKDEKAFNSIVTIANTGEPVKGAKAITLDSRTVTIGSFVPQLAILPDKLIGNIPLPANLCKTPLAQGSFTRHFSYAVTLRVTFRVWCGTWRDPFRMCDRTYNVAGASLNINLNVGYRVTCCGGTAWGSASANACVTFLGATLCAGCNASIVGAVGISRSGSGSRCTYGLGLTADLRCTFAGITVFYLRVPFGYTLTGPCPPLPC